MKSRLSLVQALKWLLVTSLLSTGLAMAQAQTEPTLNQVYATAQAGNLDQAQLMIQQVLISHPNSGKAFFVQSELYARKGDMARASESLATAEKLAPGLPFAKPDAVQKLRAQLAAKKSPTAGAGMTTHAAVPTTVATAAPTAPFVPATSPVSWALPLLLTGGVIGLAYFLFRQKKPAPLDQQPGTVNQGGLGGPQSFGSTVGGTPFGQAAYAGVNGSQTFGVGGGAMQQPYAQPVGSGLGGRIMGGVATGLAVGAGMMAVEAIGKNLMGGHNTTATTAATENLTNNDFQALDRNPDMGGKDFGINDTSSWDDAGSMDVGGGGDWDN
jgi:hypothetical protein